MVNSFSFLKSGAVWLLYLLEVINRTALFCRMFIRLHWYPQVIGIALYSMILMLCGRICLSLFRIPIICEHLLVILSECFFQFKFESSVNPRNLNCSTFSMFVLFILGTGGLIALCFCWVWKTINFDFVTLSDSLLISSHSLIFANSVLIIISGLIFCAFMNLFNVLKSVVSSA